MKSYGLKPDVVTYNSLIDAYCRYASQTVISITIEVI
jgi:hypothetical protein